MSERVQTPLVDTLQRSRHRRHGGDRRGLQAHGHRGRQVITQGVAFTAASYDRTSQRFADMRAARDAEIRDAKNLADQIQTRIAAAMSTI